MSKSMGFLVYSHFVQRTTLSEIIKVADKQKEIFLLLQVSRKSIFSIWNTHGCIVAV